ncbi:aspartic proteinase CDR1-like [Salvia splendens]|uniref:aspartic proteinase CDR1-like n=1 Tax=Salvia splendens TaxID=180675 RepID=UPI001C262BB6|nr:aspartic proteinase CDR1-like [Salvia splendens]
MSVGSQIFDSDSSKKSVLEGNIVIDSGTTLTFLPRDLYGKVEAALKQQVSLKQIEDPHKKMKLCYDVTNIKDAEAKIPEITVHFKGADVKLKAHNTFIMSTNKGIIMGAKNAMCLAFAPAGLTPIYGNMAQMNFLIGFHTTEAAGFSIDLIHRDSLQSPSLLSPFDRVEAVLQRSFNRSKTLIIRADHHSPQSASTEIVPDTGEYLMRFALGTPKVETLAVADTGSDLTWIQCDPCKGCNKKSSPLFNPTRSSTYRSVPCRTEICNIVKNTNCEGSNGGCGFVLRYADNSVSIGDLALETLSFGQSTSFSNIVVGCSHMTRGTFSPGTSGVVGLGGGRESLLRQMGPSIGGRFSYCLQVPSSSSGKKASKMHFGDSAVVSSAGAATTPIILKNTGSLYYLTLLGMSVGNKRFNLESSTSILGGNIVIDSGTTLTFLPRDLYSKVEVQLQRVVSLKQIEDPHKTMKLCYDVTNAKDVDAKIPEITVHFRGADVKLKRHNAFIMTVKKSIIMPSKKVMCLAFAPVDLVPIYGNIAQMNFKVGYDLVKKTVSFKPTDCTTAI